MTSILPDFEGLAVFAKVAEARSYAGAARELGLSVATVSRAVARLEQRLGGRVFNRSSRQLALTAFGEALIEPAMRVCREAEQAEARAREQSSQPRGTIRLAVPMSFGVRWLAPLLPGFLRRYPQVSIDLHLSDAVVDLVAEGFDAGLRIARLPDSSLAARKLCDVARFTVAAPAYLDRHGRPEHPGELDPRDCLGYAYRARSDVWRFRRGEEEVVFRPQGPLRATNSEALLPWLLEGHAVAELPEFMAGAYLQDGRLEAVLRDWDQGAGALYFVTPTLRQRPAKIEVLGSYLHEQLSEPSWRWP